MSGSDSSSGVGSTHESRAGGDSGDGYNSQDNSSASAQNTGSASDSVTDSSVQTYAVYEAGSYAGGSYSLSSYTLVEQGSETVTAAAAGADSWADSGSDTGASAVVDGVTQYSGNGSFSNSGSSAETVAETLTSGFSLSEQGSFARGSFALASYVFSEQQSASESATESDSSTDSFSGSNQGQGYSGGGGGNSSEQEVQSSNGSVSEQGAYSNGSFALGTVTYQGSGSDSFSAGDSGSDSWTGGYSGTDSYSDQSAGNGSYNAFASGSFNGLGYALSSYVLSGGSSGSYADSSGEAATLNGAASSWANTSSGQESDSLWQSGATSGSAYSNGSYNYADGSSGTTTAQAQGPGYQSSDTWLNTAGTQETGSGTSGAVAQSGLSTYSWQEGSGSQSGNSGSSGSPSATLPGPAVVLVTPDGTTVPVAGAGAGGGGAAPVAASPSLSVVGTTANWLATTSQLAQQAVGQGQSKGSSGPGSGSGPVATLCGNDAPDAEFPGWKKGQPAAEGDGEAPEAEGAQPEEAPDPDVPLRYGPDGTNTEPPGFHLGTRLMGALQVAFGVLEVVGGWAFGTLTAETGIGMAVGALICAHGVANIEAGALTFWTGQEHRTRVAEGFEGLALLWTKDRENARMFGDGVDNGFNGLSIGAGGWQGYKALWPTPEEKFAEQAMRAMRGAKPTPTVKPAGGVAAPPAKPQAPAAEGPAAEQPPKPPAAPPAAEPPAAKPAEPSTGGTGNAPQTGRPRIGAEIGKGAEGTVYENLDEANSVVKEFTPGRTSPLQARNEFDNLEKARSVRPNNVVKARRPADPRQGWLVKELVIEDVPGEADLAERDAILKAFDDAGVQDARSNIRFGHTADNATPRWILIE